MPTRSDEGFHGTSRAGGSPAAGAMPAADQALARAVVWRFLALGFAPPSDELRHALTDDERRLGLSAALCHLGLAPFEYDDPIDLDSQFGELFGHTLRGGVCPYETEYVAGPIFQQAHELADLQGWYAAFGLQRRPDSPERGDHIGVECEFAGFLAMKEAVTLDSGDTEQRDRVRQAYRQFLRKHLGCYGTVVATRLEESDRFYGKLGSLLGRVLAAECRRLGVQPGPRTLPLQPEAADPAPAACGVSDECGQCGETSEPPTAVPSSNRLVQIHGGGQG